MNNTLMIDGRLEVIKMADLGKVALSDIDVSDTDLAEKLNDVSIDLETMIFKAGGDPSKIVEYPAGSGRQDLFKSLGAALWLKHYYQDKARDPLVKEGLGGRLQYWCGQVEFHEKRVLSQPLHETISPAIVAPQDSLSFVEME